MAVYSKPISGKDIVIGSCVVGDGSSTPKSYDDPNRSQHYASGDSLGYIQNLDTRYKVDPSGWNS